MDEVWIALAAQFPLVAAFFVALQRGWIHVGSTIDHERAERDKYDQQDREDFKNQLAEANARAAQERTDRLAADERTAKMADSLREATEVMNRSVELHEQSILGMAQNARTRRKTGG